MPRLCRSSRSGRAQTSSHDTLATAHSSDDSPDAVSKYFTSLKKKFYDDLTAREKAKLKERVVTHLIWIIPLGAMATSGLYRLVQYVIGSNYVVHAHADFHSGGG